MIEHKRRTRIAAVLLLLAVVGLALLFLRPPGVGGVYQYRSSQYGLQGSTAILLQNGNCLVLSKSETDIGKIYATPGSEHRLFAIAGAARIRSGEDERGDYLIDSQSGLRARPGDAIDGEFLFYPRIGTFKDTLAAGWPLSDRCGRGLAIAFSIARVHR